jgi:hypothetical protein
MDFPAGQSAPVGHTAQVVGPPVPLGFTEYRPASHEKHWRAAGSVVKDGGGQRAHDDWLEFGATVPAGHAVHSWRPLSLVNRPWRRVRVRQRFLSTTRPRGLRCTLTGPQAMHVTVPFAGACCPGAHAVQPDSPAVAATRPGGQGVHSVAPLAFDTRP